MWGESGYIRLKRTTECGEDTTPGDGYECDNGPASIKVCGMCGVLSDSVFPTGVTLSTAL
jgi:cathepsin L